MQELNSVKKFAMRLMLFVLFMGLIASSCQNQAIQGDEKSVDEIMDASKITNSSIVRNPVSANDPTDTVNVAKIEFEEDSYDFGEVDEGEVVTHVYKFTNTGKVPLVINNARSTCGCTVPSWPKDPIPPGEGGEIEVRFNTKNKKEKQQKPVTITANTYPSNTKVFLSGYVNPSTEQASTEK